MKRYINLNTHSNCSMGETVITPEEIVEFAVRDGADAVALTDLNSVHGFREFAIAAEKYKDRGFKPIYGVQLYGLNQEKSTTPRKFTLPYPSQSHMEMVVKNLQEADAGKKKSLFSKIKKHIDHYQSGKNEVSEPDVSVLSEVFASIPHDGAVNFKSYDKDLQAMRIAARYNMVEEYKIARRHRRSPLQALEEWDLLTNENLRLFHQPNSLIL